jgi:2-polyprenyl-3-methyl-5-hydroxy-6-metoxy-1,4-benzoquinol methylase
MVDCDICEYIFLFYIIFYFLTNLFYFSMLSPNDATIAAYDRNLERYIKHTPIGYNSNHKPLLRWINTTLTHVRAPGKILEVGSGLGREADYIESLGFDILRSDAAYSFVEYLHSQTKRAIMLNALKDDFGAIFDMIFANAVTQHFTEEDMRLFLKKTHAALRPGGLLAFSTKQGRGEIWTKEKLSAKRYIHFWCPQDLLQLLEGAGYKIIFAEGDIAGDVPSHTWINITCKKLT